MRLSFNSFIGAAWAVGVIAEVLVYIFIHRGADAFAMQVSIPIKKALDDVLVALYQNGERIRPENGYPVRLIVPGYLRDDADMFLDGFKLRSNGGGHNASGGTYIYMAFAENPFVDSSGVPANAR